MTDVSAFPGGLPTDYRMHLEWVRHSAEGATIDAFDLTWAPYGDRIRETLIPFYIADDGSGLLTLTDAGMAELTENWAAKADTSFANVTVAGTLAVRGDATFAANESFYIDGPAGTTRDIIGSTLGLFRWGVSLGTSGAESGGNAGSDFAIARYSDAGTFIDAPLGIARSTGVVTMTSNPVVIAPTTGANLNLSKAAAANNASIAGQLAGSPRWTIFLAAAGTESGGNVGSDFNISRFSDAGTLIDAPLAISRASGAVTFRCSAAADNAAAGFIGEVISSNVTTGVALTTAVAANVTSISLTAGDWDVQGEVWIQLGTGGATTAHAAINTVSATVPAASALNVARATINATMAASVFQVLPLRSCRVSLAATTTFFLVALANFASGTVTATGNIWARRSR